jgi:hypothetical protein
MIVKLLINHQPPDAPPPPKPPPSPPPKPPKPPLELPPLCPNPPKPPNISGIIIIPPIPIPIPPQRLLPRALPLPIIIGSMKIKRIGKNENPEPLLLG